MYTKTELRRLKKAQLLDMLREAFPWKSTRWYESLTKEEIIEKLMEENQTWNTK